MSFEAIQDQKEAVDNLTGALEAERLAHALLFVGPDGTGKRMAAVEVARALLCSEGPRRSCGACSSCRRVERGTHSDLYPVTAEAGRSSITIAQARDLAASLAESPLEGQRKVAIIDPADAMTTEAQNALLKTLEEPPADATIILCAENAEALLPTIRSRCRSVVFTPIADDLIARFLVEKGLPKEAAELTAKVAQGSFTRAAALVEEGGASERRELLELVAADSPQDRPTLRAVLLGGQHRSLQERREHAISLVAMLHSFLVDCVRAKSGARLRTNFDMAQEIGRFTASRTADQLADLEKETSNAIIMLSMNADIGLVAEGLTAKLLSGLRENGA